MTDTQVQSVTPRSSARLPSIGALVGFLALGTGVVLLAVNNLGNRYFWTDESSSLYTALGWPGVGDRAGSLAGAWNWTIETHVEPGLYNMLERFWALGVGTGIETLRVYPFLFFLIYLASLIGVGRLLRLPWFLIAGVLGLVLLENITPYYTVELRPSSAGLAASVALPFLGLMLLKWTRKGVLVLFLAGFVLIGSMQYNSYPIEAAVGIVLIAFGLLTPLRSQRLMAIGAGAFAVFYLPVLYVVTRGNPLGVAQEPGLEAISGLLIPNMETSEVLRLLQQNLFSFTALPRTVFLVMVPVLWLVGRWAKPWHRPEHGTQAVNQVWLFVLTATLGSAGIGFLGVMPWIVGTRWSIAEVGLIAVSLIGIGSIIVQLGLLRIKPVAVLAVAASVGLALAGSYRLATYERFPGYDWNIALTEILEGTPGKAVVDTEIYPNLRYWVELSGDYDQFRSAWIDHRIQTTSDFYSADASSIEEFLASDNEYLLLGDASLLEGSGVRLPADVTVRQIPVWGAYDGITPPQPVLIIRPS